MMDRDGRSGAGDRPRAPHPWDPTPKKTAASGPTVGRVLIQSAITKRGKGEEEANEDDDNEERRKKRGREDDDEEDDDADGDGDSKVEYSSMRMDKPSADLEPSRASKSRRVFAESDGDKDRDARRDHDRDRDRDRRRDAGRDRQQRSPRDQRAAAADGDTKERGEGTGKVQVCDCVRGREGGWERAREGEREREGKREGGREDESAGFDWQTSRVFRADAEQSCRLLRIVQKVLTIGLTCAKNL